jgi:hypothetical protein
VYNSIQLYIIYVPSQGQLQTQRSVDKGNYSMDKHNIKSKTNYRQELEEIILLRVSWEASLYRDSLLGNSSVARHPAPT